MLASWRRARAGRDDSGSTLMETMVALFALSLVATAAATFFVSSVRTTAGQSQAQEAIAVATESLDAVRAVPVSRLLVGRQMSDVQALTAPGGPVPASYTADDDLTQVNWDPTAQASSVAVVPVTRSVTDLKGTPYTVRTLIDYCWFQRGNGTCTRTDAAGTQIGDLRATVFLTWGDSGCTLRCRYAASTLVDTQTDPTFALATSQPVIVTMTPATVVMGSSVNVSVSGIAFGRGATLTPTTAGGGSFSVASVSADGKKATGTWTAGTTAGSYTVALTNPDGGRAEYAPVTVLPDANDDCVVGALPGTATTVYVLANDQPSSGGTLTITKAATGGTATVIGGGTAISVTPSGPGKVTLQYTLTSNGQTSAAATVTVNGGVC